MLSFTEEKAKSKICVFRHFLKVAVEEAKWTYNGMLFHREGAQKQNALVPALVFTLRTDRVITLCYRKERDGSDAASIVCT